MKVSGLDQQDEEGGYEDDQMDDGETSEKLYAHYLARKVCEDVGIEVQLLVVEIWCGTKLGWREMMDKI
jgi:hypothetical protein